MATSPPRAEAGSNELWAREEERRRNLRGPELERFKGEEEDTNRDLSARGLDVRTYTAPRFRPRCAIVCVSVGEDTSAEPFQIHEDVLKEHSKFFTAALRKDWSESRHKSIRLPEDDPKLVEIFVNFIYNGRIFSTDDKYDFHAPRGKVMNLKNDGGADDPEWDRLASCWILGDKLGSETFQDACMDAIIQKMMETGRPPFGLHRIAYSMTCGDNPLKRLAVDAAAWRHRREDFDNDEGDEIMTQFHLDTIARLQGRSCMKGNIYDDGPEDEPWLSCPCEVYHTHGPDGVHRCYDSSLALGGYR